MASICMKNYDIISYTQKDIDTLKIMEDCAAKLKSEKFKGIVNDEIMCFLANKRLINFIVTVYNSSPNDNTCNCEAVLDCAGEPDCMHPGNFDVQRVSWSASQDNHCLICGIRNLTETICAHTVVHNDCEKVSRGTHATSSAGTIARLLSPYLAHDKMQVLFEKSFTFHCPEYIILQREWQKRARKAENVLECIRINRREVDETKYMAVAMALHERLGAKASIKIVSPDVIYEIMILVGIDRRVCQ